MGNPQHFSRDLPQRCQQLLRDLYFDLPHREGSGPVPLKLKATFLLAISMPMINLPLERINKYRDDGQAKRPAAEHMNDFQLDPRVADAVKLVIDENTLLKDAPFFSAGAWRYHELAKGNGFPNLAKDGLPKDIAEKLRHNSAEAGNVVSTKLFCEILRNSLAHGGVLFLNEQGESSYGDPVRKFAFVSTKGMNNPSALHILRIGMKEYRTFLNKWAAWLKKSGVQKQLETSVEGEATEMTDDKAALAMAVAAG